MMNLSRSTYYYKSKQLTLTQKIQEANLRDRIEKILCDFPGYGRPRVTQELRRQGLIVNHKRVGRIMRENNLLCVVKRSWFKTTDSVHDYPRYPNLIQFLTITGPNQVWVSDITYIRILTAFIYLAVVLDAFSRKVISFHLSEDLDSTLTLTALKMALEDRKPKEGCIHHSDQGVQYACFDYTNLLKEHKFRISMAATGNPYQNAIAESFFKTLKYEEVYLWDYQTVNDVVERIPFFIQEVYNCKRLHSSLGYLPPEEFEQNFVIKQQYCQLITS